MKKVTFTVCALFLAMGFIQLKAQSADDMKKWELYMTPSDVHKMIAKSDGKWHAEISMWWGPGMPEQKMEGVCTNSMILGGRYQQSNHTGSFNGEPFEGMAILAYDNALKVFTNTWIDNMGTGMIVMKGTWDEATKSVNLKGEETDPMSGKTIAVREVWKMVDDNTQTLENYKMGPDGKEYKSMVIKYTRKS
jgi:hypothetical protein